MLTAILALPLWPFDLLAFSAFGVLIVAANLLPIWAQTHHWEDAPSYPVVRPSVVVWLTLVGLAAVIHWTILVACLPGLLVSIVFVNRGRPDGSMVSEAWDARELCLRDERLRAAGETHLKNLVAQSQPIELSILLGEDLWREMLDERRQMLANQVEILVENTAEVLPQTPDIRFRLLAALYAWHDLIIARELGRIGAKSEASTWLLPPFAASGDSVSTFDRAARDIHAILCAQSSLPDDAFGVWVSQTTGHWVGMDEKCVAQLTEVWVTHRTWILDAVYHEIGVQLS